MSRQVKLNKLIYIELRHFYLLFIAMGSKWPTQGPNRESAIMAVKITPVRFGEKFGERVTEKVAESH